MNDIEIAPEARADLIDILRYSRHRFGRSASQRYHALIDAAYAALAEDPQRVGVEQVGKTVRLFHIRHVKASVRVADPRHIVVFIHDRRGVRVARLFHDAMDLPARLRDL